MTRLHEIAHLAGLDPRAAITVSGIEDALADQMCQHALAGLDAEAIVAAVGTPTIQDGYRRRPLAPCDANQMIAFVAAVRRRLHDLDRALDTQAADQDRLLALLDPPEVPA
jgi:hypothetical protein